MKNKTTAVKWFFDVLRRHHIIEVQHVRNTLLKAKEIEKKQKIEFAKHCLNKALDTDIRTAYQDVEKYYNEIYGTADGSSFS